MGGPAGKARPSMQNAESRSTQPATRNTPRTRPIPLLSQAGTLNVAAGDRFCHATRDTQHEPLRPAPQQHHPAAPASCSAATAPSCSKTRCSTRPGPCPSIPDHLRAQGDPGSYLVQARGPIDDAFRSLLKAAGATIVSYIPNNAYLVRASAAVARAVAGGPADAGGAALRAVLQAQALAPEAGGRAGAAAGQQRAQRAAVRRCARGRRWRPCRNLGVKVLGRRPVAVRPGGAGAAARGQPAVAGRFARRAGGGDGGAARAGQRLEPRADRRLDRHAGADQLPGPDRHQCAGERE